jgi:hypothetical protein
MQGGSFFRPAPNTIRRELLRQQSVAGSVVSAIVRKRKKNIRHDAVIRLRDILANNKALQIVPKECRTPTCGQHRILVQITI